MSKSVSRWSTIRFRPAKNRDGWVLVGVPRKIHHLVIDCLKNMNVEIVDTYDSGEFFSVLCFASSHVVQRLSLSFPTPPEYPPICRLVQENYPDIVEES